MIVVYVRIINYTINEILDEPNVIEIKEASSSGKNIASLKIHTGLLSLSIRGYNHYGIEFALLSKRYNVIIYISYSLDNSSIVK